MEASQRCTAPPSASATRSSSGSTATSRTRAVDRADAPSTAATRPRPRFRSPSRPWCHQVRSRPPRLALIPFEALDRPGPVTGSRTGNVPSARPTTSTESSGGRRGCWPQHPAGWAGRSIPRAPGSHLRTVRSLPPVTRSVPFSLKAVAKTTPSAWPSSARNLDAAGRSQRCTSDDCPAVASRSPSGLKATP